MTVVGVACGVGFALRSGGSSDGEKQSSSAASTKNLRDDTTAAPVSGATTSTRQPPTTVPMAQSGDSSFGAPPTESSGCDEGALSLSELTGLESPLFAVGEINVIDLINSELESTRESVGKQVLDIFPPQVVCAGAEMNVADLGTSLGVDACRSLDFLDETDVLAFGIEKTGLVDTGFFVRH